MPKRRFDDPHWVRYEVSHLVEEHLSAWAEFCRERDRLQEGPLRGSPSEMHRANHARPRMETTGKLLDLALGAVGAVQLNGRLFENAMSIVHAPKAASEGTQAAKGLFVEFVSPINGKARKAK